MRATAWIPCTGLLLALAAAQAPASPPTAAALSDAPPAAGAAVPAAVPNLKVTTLDGQAWDLATRRGRWVVVNFWATWCSPCLKEIPDLTALDAKREDLDVIGLAYEEIAPADMQAFLLQHPAGYPIAILDVYDPPKDFETPRGLPMTYLIAPDGQVAQRFLGPVTSQELEKAIAAHPEPAA